MQQVVDVVLRGSVYKVACREGERARLEELASRLSNRINAAVPGYERSKASDTLLLLLVGLQLEDKVEELENALRQAECHMSEYKAQCERGSEVIDSLKNLLRSTISTTNEIADSLSVEK
ncbi:cell division protein ZapA [Candidatus Anaplasma sp. TIGMIC]|uniref:cell division protein ZapA n=1 Tax=Candidatus Anaplasma sp. TIGMIC TaxID=3020713 RepID=UPI00232E8EE1|nr:cell division protein ZapA [Candidatus Anaplasma sp. TIGMIC]MDB1135207.1 cell division protein ZapA [Candidatus Anaplasma sp. TIGMIC]